MREGEPEATPSRSAAELTEMSRARCEELLGENNVGRLAWQAADGPQIFPISYAYHEGAVVFRTSPYGVLSELVRPTEVAMEIDGLDQRHRIGWSVVVYGRAEAVAEPQEMVQMWTLDGVVPWASGVRNLFIKIVPRRITGRALESGS